MVLDPASLSGAQQRALLRHYLEANPGAAEKLQGTLVGQRKARAALAAQDINTFIPFVLRDEETGGAISQAPYHEDLQDLVDRADRTVIWGHVELGKALAIDTPVPTAGGFVPMGDLRVGDTVYDEHGQPCSVTFATPVQHERTCYQVVFGDGSSLVTDAEHQWSAWTSDRYAKGRDPVTVTTQEILDRGVRVGRTSQYRWRVPMPKAVEYPATELPVHPYVLGVWLGDGDSQGPQLTCHVDDLAIIERCIELENGVCGQRRRQGENVIRQGVGVSVHHKRDPRALSKRLRALGLINNKHIPDQYLRSSVDQRRELLRGLLDTDGTASTHTANGIEFTQSDFRLANQVCELARSLGQRAHINGRPGKWRVTWCHVGEWLPFHLIRKANRIVPRSRTRRLAVKSIVGITPVPSVPVRCISVDSPNRLYLAGRSYTVTHNTQQVSIGRPLFELGRNPDLRIVIVQATATQAKKIVRTVGEHIERNKWLHMVFPTLTPATPWNTEQLTVKRSQGIIQPSFQAIGAHGNILGARIDLLILDDILTMENTRTAAGREDIYQWFKSTLLGRMTPNSRVIFLGNAWHPDDAMHRLAREGWSSRKFPVRDATTGKTNWAERWPNERIESKAKEFGPVEAARQLDCLARSEDAARFKREWIDWCLDRGRGLDTPFQLTEIPKGCHTFTGVDLGVKKGLHNDLTVLFTVMSHPDGTIQVVNLESGKWSAPDIVTKIFEAHVRYKSRVLVEDNGAQDFIRQFAKHLNQNIPVFPFNTRGSGKVGNKNHPQYGVEGIAAEMANSRWIIPCDTEGKPSPEIEAWIQEMLYYDPRGHTGDRLMASWFAREGSRRRFTHRLAVAYDESQADMVSAEAQRIADRKKNGYPTRVERRRAAIAQFWDDFTI